MAGRTRRTKVLRSGRPLAGSGQGAAVEHLDPASQRAFSNVCACEINFVPRYTFERNSVLLDNYWTRLYHDLMSEHGGPKCTMTH